MNWNKQVEILNKNVNKIINDLNIFDKNTDINFFVKKFTNICSKIDIVNEMIFNIDNNTISYINNTDNDTNNTNINNDISKLFVEKKIKRKHLMKKIHPDKLKFTINKIKNIIKKNDLNLFESCDFDKETSIISNCVVKILSENMNIINSLKLLYTNTKLFRYICEDLKVSNLQIDKFIEYFNSNNLSGINIFSREIFSKEILQFVDTFNAISEINSLHKQVKKNLMYIYEQIVYYLEFKIIKKIYDKKNNLSESLRDKDYLVRKLDREKDYKYKSIDTIEIISDEINQITEQINMFKEENYIYLDKYEKLSSLTIVNFIEIYKNINTDSFDLNQCLVHLRIKLPIFYGFLNKLGLEYFSEYHSKFYKAYQLEDYFNEITTQEISRINLKI